MMQGNPRNLRKEQEWRQRIHAWQQSGLTARVYCARHGLSEPSFYSWRRELAKRDAASAAFVPVHVEGQTAPAATLEVVLEGGRTIRVPAGFNSATLKQLLAVLEAPPSC